MLVSSALGQQTVKMTDILNTIRQQGHLKDPEVVTSAEIFIADAANPTALAFPPEPLNISFTPPFNPPIASLNPPLENKF